MPPNHALQRTRRERRGCNRCVPCAGSLSLGRSTTPGYAFGRKNEEFPTVKINVSQVPPSPSAAQDGLGAALGEGGTGVQKKPPGNFYWSSGDAVGPASSNHALKPHGATPSFRFAVHAVVPVRLNCFR
jgi:hypothetical protein